MRALLVTLILFASTAARADGDIGVIVTGEATLQPQLVAQVEGWLRHHGHQLAPAALEPDAINTLIDCVVVQDDACVRTVVDKRSRSGSIVFARADVTPTDDGTRNVTLVGYWLVKGHDAVAERRNCERCSEQSLRNAADDMMTALAHAGELDPGHLALRSTPAGAKVLIDGTPVGVTPLDYDLAPGNHKISVTADKHDVETRDVIVRKGETTTVEVPLKPIGSTGGSFDDTRRSHLVPGLVIGAGAVAAIAGVVMIATDKGVPSPIGPQQPTYQNSSPGDYVLAGAGAVAIGVGVYLWLRASSHPSSAPIATVTRDGGVVGWSGRF